MQKSRKLDAVVFVSGLLAVSSAFAVPCFRQMDKYCCDLLPAGVGPNYGGLCPSIIVTNNLVSHVRNADQYELGQIGITQLTPQNCVWTVRLWNGRNCIYINPNSSASCTPEQPSGDACWGSSGGGQN
jgi:hypothetical protein